MERKEIFILAILLIGLCGCKDFLNVSPDYGISEDDVFSDYEAVRGYLDNMYVALMDYHTWNSQNRMARSTVNALSDEAGRLNNSGTLNAMNSGNWLDQAALGELGWAGGTGSAGDNVITNAFYSIRIANRIIEKIDEVPDMSIEQREELLGQAHFFRAWNYFQVIQRWGGMPILDKAYNSDDNFNLERLTYQESTEWMLADLEKAIELLPHKWDDNQYGRVTKVAAMAVKSMATLYAASPLMQNGLHTLQYKEYSQEWSERAAEYANDVIEYVNNGTGGTRYKLMSGDEYENIFYHQDVNASAEALWYNMDAGARNQKRGLRVHYLPQRFSGGTGNDATYYSNPTQNIVDMFEVINNSRAYPIDHPNSGYDPQEPFKNRDPRFYNNIIVPGEAWGVDGSGNQLYQELYVNGRDYNITTSSNYTRDRALSGYMCKKFIWPEANTFTKQYGLNRVNTIYIRVSQVYLDYAEAMNEAYGPNVDPEGYGLTAVEAVNIIRNRVNMPDVIEEYTTTKEEFRDRIRNERAVELMWENHRWHDLRRWMVAEEVFSEPIKGIRATPPEGHRQVEDKGSLDFDYEVVELETEERVFDLRHHWYPVSQPDVENLSNFDQNPGW